MKPGELFFIDCSKEHHYGAISNEVEFIFIHFNGKQVSELFNYLTKEESYVFDQRTSLQAGHILKQLIKACQKENVSLNANRFSVLIYDMLLSLNGNEHNPLIIEESMVSQSIKYIYEHIGKKISLEDLAQAAGISKYYFSHRFKEELGCSPMFYLKMVRIDVAKQLLQTTSLSVKEIAKFVGFENQNSFTQVFTKQVGCSPTYYKKYEGKK